MAELSKAYPMDNKMTEVAGAPAAATHTPAKFENPTLMKGGKNKKNKKNSKKSYKKRKYQGGNNNVDMKNMDDMAGGNNVEMKNQGNDMTGGNNVDMKNQNNVDMKNNESKSFFSDWFGGKSKKRKGKKDKKKRKSARKH